MVVTKSLWSSPNQFGQTEIILDQPKLFWSHRTRQKGEDQYDQLSLVDMVVGMEFISLWNKFRFVLGFHCRRSGAKSVFLHFFGNISIYFFHFRMFNILCVKKRKEKLTRLIHFLAAFELEGSSVRRLMFSN